MNPIGILLIVFAVLINTYNYAMLATLEQYNSFDNYLGVVSLFLGATSLILMAFTQVIATRLAFVERIFGSLDKSYVLHKWLGILAFITFYLHDTFKDPIESLGMAHSDFRDLSLWFGEQGLNGLMALTIVSVLIFIPYRWWKLTHKFIGVFFVFSALHYVLIELPFSMWSFTGLWVLGFCVLGTLAIIYTLLPPKYRQWHEYHITATEQINDVTVITVTPKSKTISKHQAGQFAFIELPNHTANSPKKPLKHEYHPFTMSNAPNADNSLRFSIKALGDHTDKLANVLSVGQVVKVQGAYGRFTRKTINNKANCTSKPKPQTKTEIWIAGGIGITPFSAWSQALTADDNTVIHLFYAVKTKADVVHLAEIAEKFQLQPHWHLHLIESASMPRLSGQQIADTVKMHGRESDISKAKVYFCGSKTMRKSLAKQLKSFGVRNKNFHYEEFEMRTGIGIETSLAFVGNKIGFDVSGKIENLIRFLNKRLTRLLG